MNLKFDTTEQREFKKIFGESFFKNMSKNGQSDAFNRFWMDIFAGGESPEQILKKINLVNQYFKEGPLINWAKWLKGKFILFVWSRTNINLELMLKELGLSLEELEEAIVDFLPSVKMEGKTDFLILGPHKKLNLLYEDLSIEKDISVSIKEKEHFMYNLELGFFSSWNSFFELKSNNKKRGRSNFLSLRRSLKYLGLYFGTITLGLALVFILFYHSSKKGKQLIRDLNVSIPSFERIDLFTGPKNNISALSETSLDADVAFDNDSGSNDPILADRFDTESEIKYVDFKSISKFIREGRKTEFEEETQGVFRENRYGQSRVYRIMIESSDSIDSAIYIKKLLNEFEIKKGGKVEPGIHVPGGNYFNLVVPDINLSNFISSLKKFKPSIYISKSKGRKLKGNSKVFVFLKKI